MKSIQLIGLVYEETKLELIIKPILYKFEINKN